MTTEIHSSSTSLPDFQADSLQLDSCQNGRLGVVLPDGTLKPVNVTPCFPWTDQRRHLSLRDDEGKEIAHIADLEALSQDYRRKIEEAMQPSRFAFEILRLLKIEKDFELRVWHVETDRGFRRFQTLLDDLPYVLDNGTVLFKDLAGDLYQVSDPQKLDRDSLRKLIIYID